MIASMISYALGLLRTTKKKHSPCDVAAAYDLEEKPCEAGEVASIILFGEDTC